MEEINYKCNLINSIKNKYILKKIFYNLIKIKTLYIVRYNKILQIADTIIGEIRFLAPEKMVVSFANDKNYKILEYQHHLFYNYYIQ